MAQISAVFFFYILKLPPHFFPFKRAPVSITFGFFFRSKVFPSLHILTSVVSKGVDPHPCPPSYGDWDPPSLAPSFGTLVSPSNHHYHFPSPRFTQLLCAVPWDGRPGGVEPPGSLRKFAPAHAAAPTAPTPHVPCLSTRGTSLPMPCANRAEQPQCTPFLAFPAATVTPAPRVVCASCPWTVAAVRCRLSATHMPCAPLATLSPLPCHPPAALLTCGPWTIRPRSPAFCRASVFCRVGFHRQRGRSEPQLHCGAMV